MYVLLITIHIYFLGNNTLGFQYCELGFVMPHMYFANNVGYAQTYKKNQHLAREWIRRKKEYIYIKERKF